jgi:hypothetical protein
MGIYGALAYSVAQRPHEIGIRASVGADSLAAARLVGQGTMFVSGVGASIPGAPGADPFVGYGACLRRELSGEPDAGNLHVRLLGSGGRSGADAPSGIAAVASQGDRSKGLRRGVRASISGGCERMRSSRETCFEGGSRDRPSQRVMLFVSVVVRRLSDREGRTPAGPLGSGSWGRS